MDFREASRKLGAILPRLVVRLSLRPNSDQITSEETAATTLCMQEMAATVVNQQKELESLRAVTQGQRSGRSQPQALLRRQGSVLANKGVGDAVVEPTSMAKASRGTALYSTSRQELSFDREREEDSTNADHVSTPHQRRIGRCMDENSACSGDGPLPAALRAESECRCQESVEPEELETGNATSASQFRELVSTDQSKQAPAISLIVGEQFSSRGNRAGRFTVDVSIQTAQHPNKGRSRVSSSSSPSLSPESRTTQAERTAKLVEWLLPIACDVSPSPQFPCHTDHCMCDRLGLENLRYR